MDLNEHIRRVVQRSRAFYQATEPGHFLVRVHVPAESPPVPPLRNFALEKELTKWLDCRLAALRPSWTAKEGIDDCRYLRKIEIYFQNLISEREHIDELHNRVTSLLLVMDTVDLLPRTMLTSPVWRLSQSEEGLDKRQKQLEAWGVKEQ